MHSTPNSLSPASSGDCAGNGRPAGHIKIGDFSGVHLASSLWIVQSPMLQQGQSGPVRLLAAAASLGSQCSACRRSFLASCHLLGSQSPPLGSPSPEQRSAACLLLLALCMPSILYTGLPIGSHQQLQPLLNGVCLLHGVVALWALDPIKVRDWASRKEQLHMLGVSGLPGQLDCMQSCCLQITLREGPCDAATRIRPVHAPASQM